MKPGGPLKGRAFHTGPCVCGDTVTCQPETTSLPLFPHRRNPHGWGNFCRANLSFPLLEFSQGPIKEPHLPSTTFLEMLEAFLPASPHLRLYLPRGRESSDLGAREVSEKSTKTLFCPQVLDLCHNSILLDINPLF